MTGSVRNLKMVLAYEGSRYVGFQRQQNGPSIQGELESALLKLSSERINVHGAGRTDSGVHAKGQVVNFFTKTTIPINKFQTALNAILPFDILICSIEEVPLDFQARYSAKSKTYSYRIYNHKLRPLFERNFVLYYKYPLDFEMMRKAISLINGRHDFKCFQASGSFVKTSVRTVYFTRLQQKGPEIIVEINADGFLYHMVRNIIGTLIMVGNGKLGVEDFEKVMKAGDRSLAGPTAPSKGLCLEEVLY